MSFTDIPIFTSYRRRWSSIRWLPKQNFVHISCFFRACYVLPSQKAPWCNNPIIIQHPVDTLYNALYILLMFSFSGFGGLVVSMLASGTQDRGFDPGRSRRIFPAKKSTACLPWGGSKAVSHVADLRGMSKNPGFTWKSKSQAKLTGHFSPVIPSFADRGPSCRLHVEAPRGESGNV